MSPIVAITVNQIPAQPVISRDINNNLVSSSSDGNQWYSGASIISGANNQLYKPSADGYYKVQVILNNCSGAISDAYYYLVTAVLNVNNNHAVSVYPNPVSSELKIDFNLQNNSNVNVELYDFKGVKLVEKNISSGSKIVMSNYSNGYYMLMLTDTKTHKMIYSSHIIKVK